MASNLPGPGASPGRPGPGPGGLVIVVNVDGVNVRVPMPNVPLKRGLRPGVLPILIDMWTEQVVDYLRKLRERREKRIREGQDIIPLPLGNWTITIPGSFNQYHENTGNVDEVPFPTALYLGGGHNTVITHNYIDLNPELTYTYDPTPSRAFADYPSITIPASENYFRLGREEHPHPQFPTFPEPWFGFWWRYNYERVSGGEVTLTPVQDFLLPAEDERIVEVPFVNVEALSRADAERPPDWVPFVLRPRSPGRRLPHVRLHPEEPPDRPDTIRVVLGPEGVTSTPDVTGTQSPPGPRVREKKGSTRFLAVVLFALSQVTEADDAIQAIYDSLPWWARRFKGRDGRWRTRHFGPDERLEAIYEYFEYVDISDAIDNLISNEIQDQIAGRISRGAHAAGGHGTGYKLSGANEVPYDAVSDVSRGVRENDTPVGYGDRGVTHGAPFPPEYDQSVYGPVESQGHGGRRPDPYQIGGSRGVRDAEVVRPDQIYVERLGPDVYVDSGRRRRQTRRGGRYGR